MTLCLNKLTNEICERCDRCSNATIAFPITPTALPTILHPARRVMAQESTFTTLSETSLPSLLVQSASILELNQTCFLFSSASTRDNNVMLSSQRKQAVKLIKEPRKIPDDSKTGVLTSPSNPRSPPRKTFGLMLCAHTRHRTL